MRQSLHFTYLALCGSLVLMTCFLTACNRSNSNADNAMYSSNAATNASVNGT